MRLRELEIFNALMKARTTTGAAELLSISQPAVSKALKHLEAQSGLTLFQRVRGRLCPTPEAQTLHKNVSNVFARLETIDRIAQDLRGGRGGVISVAATPTLGSSLLARAVVRFRREHPDVEIIFRSITSYDVARRVAGGEADFGTVHREVDRAGLEVEELMQAEIVCILPHNHPLARQPFVSLPDLLPHPLISYRPGTPIGKRIAQAFQAAGLEKQVDLQTSLSSTACLLTAEGSGIAVTDPFTVIATPFPSLVVRAVRPRIRVGVDLLFSRENPSSGIATKLVEQVRAVAADMTASIAQLIAVPERDGPRHARTSRRGATSGLASGRKSATHLAGGAP
jgi:DNA-binding transcriptional LysR family regulator